MAATLVNSGYSICIPIFNQNVEQLVNELHRQASFINEPFEIVLMDDCSQLHKEENRRLQELPFVRYTELAQNIGRSAIRNQLAENAKYETLIIMDCDALVPTSEYLQNYLKLKEKAVIIGGCLYPDTPPENPAHLLRWVYGKTREERTALVRNQKPHSSFTPFNLLIQKSILLSVRFDESFKGYGHEDTLFGWQLKKAGIPVLHIDNPLIHNHQDKSEIFLKKTEEATLNLWRIYEKMGGEKEAFTEDIKSLRYFAKLQKWHFSSLVAFCISAIKKRLIQNLLSKQPNIRFLDLLKLLWLHKAKLIFKIPN